MEEKFLPKNDQNQKIFLTTKDWPKLSFPCKKGGKIFLAVFFLIVFSLIAGGLSGFLFSHFYFQKNIDNFLNLQQNFIPSAQNPREYVPQTNQEQKIIDAVKNTSPAVVSIIITKDIPIFEKYYINPFGQDWPFNIEIPQYREKGTKKQQIGGGTGFIISSDGMVLTNKHVVSEKGAEYTIFTNDGEKFPAKILVTDPYYDLAVLKIDQTKSNKKRDFSVAKIGDSSNLQIGQTVIAIGNALGEFENTVSVGVVSGLARTITATGGGMTEILEDVIQTDAAINSGNSGGPLLNIAGEVIGVNVARAVAGENIGFAIPINRAKKAIEQVKKTGKIVYPYLGVYYALITKEMKQEFGLAVDYGAWVGRDSQGQKTNQAVIPGTPAEKSGIKRDDIILEFGGEKITPKNSLAKIIQNYNPGESVQIKILRNNEEKTITLVLGERDE